MEPNLYCSFCYSPASNSHEEIVEFTCKHLICFRCFPYIIMNIISNNNLTIDLNFLQKLDQPYECPLCNKGTNRLPMERISDFFSNILNHENKDASNKHICQLCLEKTATKYCPSCEYKEESKLCDECMKDAHNKTKMKDHIVYPISQAKNLCIEYICSCKKNINEFFCMDCSSWLCTNCLNIYHNNHNAVKIDYFFSKYQNLPQNTIKKWLEELLKSYKSLKKNILIKNNQEILNYSDNFDKHIDKLINILHKMKKESHEFLAIEFSKVKKQLNLIELAINMFYEGFNSNSTKQPTGNQKYQIVSCYWKNQNLLSSLNENILRRVDFESDFTLIQKFQNHFAKIFLEFTSKKIDKFNENVNEMDNHLIKMLEKCPSTNLIKQENFQSDPITLLQNQQIEIEKKSFSPSWIKSGVCCSFLLSEESFLAWAGYSSPPEKYHLIIYNLSRRQRVKAYQSDRINVVSTFSTTTLDMTPSKNWLYTAGEEGIVRIYSLSRDPRHRFKELSEISTEAGGNIVSAIIFEDKYNELKPVKCDVYALIYLNDTSKDILLYKFDGSSDWQKFRNIQNPIHKSCYTVNYYHDEIFAKTLIFFGFSADYVKTYNLAKNSWESSQLKTHGAVWSINFIVKPQINSISDSVSQYSQKAIADRYIIYTYYDRNMIILRDINTGTILKELTIPIVKGIKDLCV